ncbi:hypothetical protein IQ07DRAFT_686168 [Pyrenochaeta sp. DS3sAY3a]|nr:hypothetical protein IQ07DRAFT_686168 [Pyrenochaeta sp. DS3sAY3a]
MTAYWGRCPFFVVIRTLAPSILFASCAAEYVPETITDTPGYTLLAGVSHVPAPIVVSPDEASWVGIDGTWNTFSLSVGTQRTNTSVLVSTTNQQIWVINVQACTVDVLGSLPDAVAQMSSGHCASGRGFLFNTSQSSTWSETGYYGLQTPQALGTDQVGLFGLDTVSLGPQGQEGPTVSNTTIVKAEHVRTAAFPGLFQTQGIPSQSFGYTAGARYRENTSTSYYGSLILGGYDASRFIPNDMIFTPDTDRNLVICLAGLTATILSASDIDLLDETNVDLYIDSTVAEIWLPVNICKAFEEALGLIYDEATSLYLVDDILHQRLLGLNLNITFTLRQAASTSAAGTVEVTLPYAAFDLHACPPYQDINQTTRCFPIRRGTNQTQRTVGRTLLQEAYLTVDWERSQFYVYPCDWTGKPSDVTAIVSPRYGNESTVGNTKNPFADANAITQPIYEMIGDIPATEAGGRQLSENESMIVREKTINGVDPNGTPVPASPPIAGRSALVTSLDEIAITSRMYNHRASVSTGAARTKSLLIYHLIKLGKRALTRQTIIDGASLTSHDFDCRESLQDVVSRSSKWACLCQKLRRSG